MLFALCVLLAVLAAAVGGLLLWNARLKRKISLIEAIDRNTKSLMCIVDLNAMQIVSASNAAVSVVGKIREDVIGRDPKEMIHPDDLELLRTNLRLARDRFSKGFPVDMTFEKIKIRIQDVDCGWQWYELNAFLFLFHTRELLCCSFFPVDDQMRLREELMTVKAQMSVLLNNSFNIVWRLDCFTRQLYLMTPVIRERFGIDDHPIGLVSSNEEHFPHEEILAFREMLNRRISALSESGKKCDSSTEFRLRVKNRDGSVVRLLTNSTLEKNDLGQFTLYGVSQRIPDGN